MSGRFMDDEQRNAKTDGFGYGPLFGIVRKTGRIDLDSLDQAIVGLFEGRDGLSTNQVALGIQRSARTARERLKRLIGLGLVYEVASSPKDPRKQYRLVGSKRV